jgi:hypothetical protein
MKHFPVRLAALALAAFLCQCATPVNQRIAAHPEAYQTLTDHERDLVQCGEVRRGMSQDAVALAWGEPTRRSVRMFHGHPLERWTYSGYVPTYGAHTTYDLGDGVRRRGHTGPLLADDSLSGNARVMNVRSTYFYDGQLEGWSTLW